MTNLITRALSWLSKPFPQEETFFDSVKIIAAISIFVVFFLYVFKPFGIDRQQTNQFWLCLSFGAVTFIASLVYEVLVVFVFRLKGRAANFTFGHWILYFCGVMLFISLANFIFVQLLMLGRIEWNLYPYMLRGVFAIGFFPAVVAGALALGRQEKKYQGIAQSITNKGNTSESRPPTTSAAIFDVTSEKIQFIEAMQNYINIHYLNEADELVIKTERATLKSLFAQSLPESLVQCHRSYLINTLSIQHIEGNAQGLLISLTGSSKKIPVSRSYVAKFKHR